MQALLISRNSAPFSPVMRPFLLGYRFRAQGVRKYVVRNYRFDKLCQCREAVLVRRDPSNRYAAQGGIVDDRAPKSAMPV